LFDNLPKPELMAPIEGENELDRLLINNDELFQAKLMEIYQEVANKPQKTAIDYKLLKWFENGEYQKE